MEYWVFEDKPTPRIRVHQGQCSHCNFGMGRNRGAPPTTTKWHGPYGDVKIAWAKGIELADARRIDDDNARECKCCLSGKTLAELTNRKVRNT